jgi:allophanate hydrolase
VGHAHGGLRILRREAFPRPLGIGTLELADGRAVKGFICEPWALAHAVDITSFGGWRAYLAACQRG